LLQLQTIKCEQQGQLRVAGSEMHKMLWLRGKLFKAPQIFLTSKAKLFSQTSLLAPLTTKACSFPP